MTKTERESMREQVEYLAASARRAMAGDAALVVVCRDGEEEAGVISHMDTESSAASLMITIATLSMGGEMIKKITGGCELVLRSPDGKCMALSELVGVLLHRVEV